MASVHILVEDDSPCCGRRLAAAAPGAARVPCLLVLLWRAALHSLGCEDCIGHSAGRTVIGGFCTC